MTTTFATRPYQTEAKGAIFREWEQGRKNTLLVLPTGTGKTIVFAKVIEELVRRGKRVLVLAHRGELLDQAQDKLRRSTGLGCAVEKADQTCLGEWERVVVGSVQSLQRVQRLSNFPADYFDAIIVDEAHHTLADGYRRVLDYFGDALVLGVTATPDRGDMKNLGEVFHSLAYEYSLPKAIRDGFLCPIKALTIPLKIDLSSVAQQNGDYQAAGLGTALDPYLEQIASEMWEHCNGRKTVVFLPLIATSQKFTELLRARGFKAVEVNGESKDRREVLEAWDSGKYDVLCNSMLLTEGWDSPFVDCIVPLRPTKIRSLFCQIVGRGTRIHPGKDHLLLLDFLWNTSRLDLCRPACLIATDELVAKKMTEKINDAGDAVDLQEAEQAAEADCVADREEALAKRLAEMRNRKRTLVDPLQYEMSIQAEDLAGYVPAFGWEMEPASDTQKKRLEKFGIFADDIECAGKAALIMDRLDKRRKEGLSTPKQIRFLEGKGFQHVGQWEFAAAGKLIDRIAANHWCVPRGISPREYTPKNESVTS